MKSPMKTLLLISMLGLGMAQAQAAERIVVLSSDIADIMVALKAESLVVGRDSLSKAPSLAHAKNIGMFRNLSAEPIVALKPTVVLGSHMAHPASIYGQLNRHKIKAVNVIPTQSEQSFAKGIVEVGKYAGKSSQAGALSQTWLRQMQARAKTGKRYVFTYDGQIVAGKNTVADTLIRLAGGVNAAAHIDGMKPIARETWATLKPDVVVIAQHSLPMVGGSMAAFKQRPEMASSAAARNNKVVSMTAGEAFSLDLNSPKVVDKLHALAR